MSEHTESGGRTNHQDRLDVCSYAEFGDRFFALAVTQERIVGAINAIAGQPIQIGPTGVGPGGLVKITASGLISPVTSEPVPGPLVSYRVELPVELRLSVDLGLETHRFDATLQVPLTLTARAARELTVFLDVVPPAPRDIEIEVSAYGLRASIVQKVAGVEGEVRRFVARYVAKELDKPQVRAARTIDVAAAIDEAWEKLSPQAPPVTAADLVMDLPSALGEQPWTGGTASR